MPQGAFFVQSSVGAWRGGPGDPGGPWNGLEATGNPPTCMDKCLWTPEGFQAPNAIH